MNKYLKQFIEKYDARNLWDIRAVSNQKAMLIPLKEWLNVINHPTDNLCFAAYRTYKEYKVQGVITQDKKYFLYEGSARYNNILNYKDPVTFVFISELNNLSDCMGYSPDYLYIRSRVPEEKKNVFSNVHTYIIYEILKGYNNFSDIVDYQDFIQRYTGEYGIKLCNSKGINQAISVILNQNKVEEVDFKSLDWEVYQDELKVPYFYPTKKDNIVNKFTEMWLDGGIYQ